MIIEARNIAKGYPEGDGRWLSVLEGLSISVERGQVVAVTGESGVGKSTLLHVLGLLDKPDNGEVFFDGKATSELSDNQRAKVRNKGIGFVFQFHHLLPEFDALENVTIPIRISGISESEAIGRAQELLDVVGLTERVNHFPNALSGGEQQRVALARALSCEPDIILADEPTGNLDTKNADRLIELLFSLAKERALAVVIATHNRELALRADTILLLENGITNDITARIRSSILER